MDKFILKGKKLVKVDLLTWAKWFETADRRVKQETLPNGLFISTVFLGIDHGFGFGKPLWFETMVFPGKEDFGELDMDRYETYEEAEEGHARMVKKWKHTNLKKENK